MQLKKHGICLLLVLAFFTLSTQAVFSQKRKKESPDTENPLYIWYTTADTVHWKLEEVIWDENHDYWLWFNFDFNNFKKTIKFVSRNRVEKPAQIKSISLSSLPASAIYDATKLKKLINKNEENPDSICDFLNRNFNRKIYIVLPDSSFHKAKLVPVNLCVSVFE